jgi:uncharacterized protein (DUF736 family)
MMIGKFTQDGDSYTGSIYTAGLTIADVTISAVPAKRGDGPDFVVLGAALGEQFELGAAWARTSKKDKPYLSVKLDGPMLVEPINCALTKQLEGSYALVWTRKKDEDDTEATPEAQAAA